MPRKFEPSMDTYLLCLNILNSGIDLVSEDPTDQVKGDSREVCGLLKHVT
jgi:hypothetical protein